MAWIGLVRNDGKEEWNARFILGDAAAEKLEAGKMYTSKELIERAHTSEVWADGKIYKAKPNLDPKRRWRCEVL